MTKREVFKRLQNWLEETELKSALNEVCAH